MKNDYARVELNGGASTNGRPAALTAAAQARIVRSEPDFAIALERDESGAAVLFLSGELDLYRAQAIQQGLAELTGSEPAAALGDGAAGGSGGEEVAPGSGSLVVDLCSVTFIDSTTLALLLAASRRHLARGGELVVRVGPETPMTAFEVTGFDRLLAIRVVTERPEAGAA